MQNAAAFLRDRAGAFLRRLVEAHEAARLWTLKEAAHPLSFAVLCLKNLFMAYGLAVLSVAAERAKAGVVLVIVAVVAVALIAAVAAVAVAVNTDREEEQ